jgi:diketogulonate reductase-like aldo/keto reductase
LLKQRDVAVIPKAADIAHVHDNLSAANLHLDRAVCDELDRAFPPPRRATSLRML